MGASEGWWVGIDTGCCEGAVVCTKPIESENSLEPENVGKDCVVGDVVAVVGDNVGTGVGDVIGGRVEKLRERKLGATEGA